MRQFYGIAGDPTFTQKSALAASLLSWLDDDIGIYLIYFHIVPLGHCIPLVALYNGKLQLIVEGSNACYAFLLIFFF